MVGLRLTSGQGKIGSEGIEVSSQTLTDAAVMGLPAKAAFCRETVGAEVTAIASGRKERG
jgi:hypothetical protein